MTEDFIDRVQRWLDPIRFKDLERVAKATGVTKATLVSLKYGRTTQPRLPTVQALQRYLDANGL
jgi:DNA-binding Xre family transcriptional regulator